MTVEEGKPEEDEILKRLNEKLEEEQKEKDLDAEVEKRLEEKKKLEPREAVFKDKDGKKKKATKKKIYGCPECGSENTIDPYEGEDVIFKHGRDLLSYVRVCKDCGFRWGETK